jgi:hypothetical protein
MHQIHRVAARADLLVDLEAALRGGAVESAERPVEGPGMRRDRRRFLGESGGGECGQRETGGDGEKARAHQCFSIEAAAPAGAPLRRVTAALMLMGSGSGRSSQPITGSSTMK